MKKTTRKLKNQIKGITLIALVVTIIVLLILAGVAINLTIGNNGIFTRAQNATQKWEEASKNEQNELAQSADIIDNYLNSSFEDIYFNTKITEMMGAKILNIGINTIGIEKNKLEEIYDKRIQNLNNLTISEKENQFILLAKNQFIYLTEKTINTVEDFLEVVNEGQENKYPNLESMIMESENDGKTYAQTLNDFLKDAYNEKFGLFELEVTKPNGEIEKVYSLNNTLEEDSEFLNLGIARLTQSGEYTIKVKLFGTNIEKTITKYIDIDNIINYEVKLSSDKVKAYLYSNSLNKNINIDEAYVYLGKEKIDVSEYIESDRMSINLGNLYANVTNNKLPFVLELIYNGIGTMKTIDDIGIQ